MNFLWEQMFRSRTTLFCISPIFPFRVWPKSAEWRRVQWHNYFARLPRKLPAKYHMSLLHWRPNGSTEFGESQTQLWYLWHTLHQGKVTILVFSCFYVSSFVARRFLFTFWCEMIPQQKCVLHWVEIYRLGKSLWKVDAFNMWECQGISLLCGCRSFVPPSPANIYSVLERRQEREHLAFCVVSVTA